MKNEYMEKKTEVALKRVAFKLNNKVEITDSDFVFMKLNTELFKEYRFKKNRNVSLEDLWAKVRTGEIGNE